MKLTTALMKFFGKKRDETIQEFADEVRKLTPEDKAELLPLIEKELHDMQALPIDEKVEL
jgi:hypothetical protein